MTTTITPTNALETEVTEIVRAFGAVIKQHVSPAGYVIQWENACGEYVVTAVNFGKVSGNKAVTKSTEVEFDSRAAADKFFVGKTK